MQSSTPANEAQLAALGGDVAGFTERAVNQQLLSVPGIEITSTLGVTEDLLGAWATENVGLITNLEADLFDRVRNSIVEGVEKGRSTRNIARDLRGQLGISQRRANLIARDQVGTLTAKVTETRQTSLGIEEYIWDNVGDIRVRNAHKDKPTGLGGTVQRWDSPPSTGPGHPGEPITCRCTALPVL